MKREIHPEPTPPELEAIDKALARLDAPAPHDQRSAWWRAGLAENVNEEGEPA